MGANWSEKFWPRVDEQMWAWERLSDVNEKISEVEKKIEGLKAWVDIEWRKINSLENSLSKISDAEKEADWDDYTKTFQMLQRAKALLVELQIEKAWLESNISEKSWFEDIQNSLTWKLAEDLEWKTRDELTAEDIHRLKESWEDLASVFLKIDGKSYSRDTVKEWDVVTVDYWKNEHAHKLIWAWDLLPRKVSKVKINWVEWEYQNKPRPWFYAWGKYLAIYDWYTIDIVSTQELNQETDKAKIAEYNNAHLSRFAKFRKWSIQNELTTKLEESEMNLESKGDVLILKGLIWDRFMKDFTVQDDSEWNFTIKANDWDFKNNLSAVIWSRKDETIKNPTMADLDKIWWSAKKIIGLALKLEKNWDIFWAKHCTDWIDKIFKAELWISVYDTPQKFNWIKSISWWTWLGVSEYASKSIISTIEPWDHIIVDKPRKWQYGVWRTHSVLALSQPVNGLIKVVSYPNGWKPPIIEKYDLEWRGRGDKNGKPIRIQWVA